MNHYNQLLQSVSQLTEIEPHQPHDEPSIMRVITAVEAVALDPRISLPPRYQHTFNQLPCVKKVRQLYEDACTDHEDYHPGMTDPSLDALNGIEAQAIGADRTSNIAVVGCGSVPNSVLAYAAVARQVTGIEYRSSAVHSARKAVAPLHNVSIHEGHGETYDYGAYGHVVVALMVHNKTKVLEGIAASAAPGTHILVRTVDGPRALLHELLGLIPTAYHQLAEVREPTEQSVHYAVSLLLHPA